MANVERIPPGKFKAYDWAHARDNPEITAQTVMADLSADGRGKLENAKRKLGKAITTADKYKSTENDDYSLERHSKHKEIIGHFLTEEKVSAAAPRAGEAPVFVMLGGRGGSGKSWFKGQVYNPDRCIVLDADEIKKLLPEHQGWNAAEVHDESSDILDVILEYCRRLNLNVVLDATMKTGANVLRKAQDFKSSGYRVEAHYMHLPRQLAAKRAVKRFCNDKNGRHVPVEVILGNTSNESNFDALRPHLDAWSFWDNDVAAGQEPTYVSGEGTWALKP